MSLRYSVPLSVSVWVDPLADHKFELIKGTGFGFDLRRSLTHEVAFIKGQRCPVRLSDSPLELSIILKLTKL